MSYSDIQVTNRMIILGLKLQAEMRLARKLGLMVNINNADHDLFLSVVRQGERTYHSGPVSAAAGEG